MRPVFTIQYLVQIGRRALAVDTDPDAYEVWTMHQLRHNPPLVCREAALPMKATSHSGPGANSRPGL